MGAKLIRSYALAQKMIEELDQSLATLPVSERPEWKILEELTAEKSISRLGEAVFSQTLCTAVQIVLVDLLQSAGVVFAAVVGHSVSQNASILIILSINLIRAARSLLLTQPDLLPLTMPFDSPIIVDTMRTWLRDLTVSPVLCLRLALPLNMVRRCVN
jgi:acyl transferase domain-containing protein